MGRSSHFTSGSGGSLALMPTGVLAGPCDVVGAEQEAPRQTAAIATEWARIVCLDMWLASRASRWGALLERMYTVRTHSDKDTAGLDYREDSEHDDNAEKMLAIRPIRCGTKVRAEQLDQHGRK